MLSSLLQSLYMTPEFRAAIYAWRWSGGTDLDGEEASASIALRQALTDACGRVANAVCTSFVSQNFPMLTPDGALESQRSTMRRALQLKRRSTFCLEPPGFSPPRKSTIDSWLSGCIRASFFSQSSHLAV